MSQTEIYVEVDEVPVTGISASERVSVTASATVNSGSAMDTLVSFHRLDTTLSLCGTFVIPLFVKFRCTCGE